MLAEPMIKPSSLIPNGIEVESFGSAYLFRFNAELQSRMEALLEKSKTNMLTPDESTEWAGIKELSRIFTFINAELAAKAQWCPTPPDNSSVNAADSAVNIAIYDVTDSRDIIKLPTYEQFDIDETTKEQRIFFRSAIAIIL
jgi:hypothetical protein